MEALLLLNKIAAIVVLVLAVKYALKAVTFSFRVLAIVVGLIALQTLLR